MHPTQSQNTNWILSLNPITQKNLNSAIKLEKSEKDEAIKEIACQALESETVLKIAFLIDDQFTLEKCLSGYICTKCSEETMTYAQLTKLDEFFNHISNDFIISFTGKMLENAKSMALEKAVISLEEEASWT